MKNLLGGAVDEIKYTDEVIATQRRCHGKLVLVSKKLLKKLLSLKYSSIVLPDTTKDIFFKDLPVC